MPWHTKKHPGAVHAALTARRAETSNLDVKAQASGMPYSVGEARIRRDGGKPTKRVENA